MGVNPEPHPRLLFERSLEGALSPGEEAVLRSHLASCTECLAEMQFARRLRAGPSPVPPVPARRLEDLRESVERSFARPPVQLPVVTAPMMAGAGAAIVVAFWLAAGGGDSLRFLNRRTAVELGGVATPGEIQRAESVKAREMAGMAPGSTPAPVLLADFEKASGLAGISFVGDVQPSFKAKAFAGRRALCLSRVGVPGNPVEIRFRSPRPGPKVAPVGVSLWMKSEGGAVDASLRLGLLGGEGKDMGPWHRFRPGSWKWTFFPVAPGAFSGGEPVAEIRLLLEGTGPVLLDRVEFWFAPRGEDNE